MASADVVLLTPPPARSANPCTVNDWLERRQPALQAISCQEMPVTLGPPPSVNAVTGEPPVLTLV